MATDVLSQFEGKMKSRLAELQPAVDEYERVRKALEAVSPLVEDGGPVAPARTRASASGARTRSTTARKRRAVKRTRRPRKTTARKTTGRAKSHQLSREKREAQLLKMIERSPGTTVAQLASRVGMTDNGVRNRINDLVGAGAVVKDGPLLTVNGHR